MARYHITGGAVQTTVSGSVASSGAVTVTITDATGWPDASVGPYHVVIDPGESNEEVILVTARSGTSLTVTSGNRGADGTSAAAHSNGAVIYPCISATYIDEANSHQNSASVHLGSGTVQTAHFAAGAVDAAALGSSAVTEAKINAGAVTEAKIGTGAVTETKLGAGSVVEAKLGTGAVTEAKLGSSAVTAGKIASDAVTTAKILDANVTQAKLAANLQPLEVRLRRTTGVSLAAGASDIIEWEVEDADASGFISVPSETLTVPAGGGGVYILTVEADALGSAKAVAGIQGSATATTYSGEQYFNGGRAALTVVRRFSDGETIQGTMHNTVGGATTTFTAALTMVRIAP
jgi:hypothetical protein